MELLQPEFTYNTCPNCSLSSKCISAWWVWPNMTICSWTFRIKGSYFPHIAPIIWDTYLLPFKLAHLLNNVEYFFGINPFVQNLAITENTYQLYITLWLLIKTSSSYPVILFLWKLYQSSISFQSLIQHKLYHSLCNTRCF